MVSDVVTAQVGQSEEQLPVTEAPGGFHQRPPGRFVAHPVRTETAGALEGLHRVVRVRAIFARLGHSGGWVPGGAEAAL